MRYHAPDENRLLTLSVLLILTLATSVAGQEQHSEVQAHHDVQESIGARERRSAAERRGLEQINRIVQHEPHRIPVILQELVDAMQSSTGDAKMFRVSEDAFSQLVQTADTAGVPISSAVANSIADQFIAMHRKDPSLFRNSGTLVVDFAGIHANSEEAALFIEKVIAGRESSVAGLESRALRALYFSKHFRGHKRIFDAISRIYSKDPNNVFALGIMGVVDPKRARPVFLRRLGTEVSMAQFNKLAAYASKSGDVVLIDGVLNRLMNLETLPLSGKGHPFTGIIPSALRQYISQAEDEKLEFALKILLRRYGIKESRDTLIRRLQSAQSARSKRVLLAAIEEATERGYFIERQMLDAVAEQQQNPDAETRRTAERVASKLRGLLDSH